MKVGVSAKRPETPVSLTLSDSLKITTWGAVRINQADFFSASFQIMFGEMVIYIDPFVINEAVRADFIFITHAHPDHRSLTDIARLAKPETIIICPRKVATKLKKSGLQLQVVKPGDVLELNRLKCVVMPAYNLRPVFLWLKAHPVAAQNVGYVLNFDTGQRLYHAGDTDYIPELDRLGRLTVALIPIGGDKLTMNCADAARLVNTLQPDIVIPMHYEISGKFDPETFRELIKSDIRVYFLR